MNLICALEHHWDTPKHTHSAMERDKNAIVECILWVHSIEFHSILITSTNTAAHVFDMSKHTAKENRNRNFHLFQMKRIQLNVDTCFKQTNLLFIELIIDKSDEFEMQSNRCHRTRIIIIIMIIWFHFGILFERLPWKILSKAFMAFQVQVSIFACTSGGEEAFNLSYHFNINLLSHRDDIHELIKWRKLFG